ncbi:MAG: Asp-tRNA(Asn)/Glu-tRNA(Gln) amidotransferase subunit GatC [bacterium]|nr:Asp-tRNA(Asn)/Glu-tRNA(Gln) amidotransferase subunit GatC [bacterium]
MLNKKDIEHLADLARIGISEAEKEGLAKDLDSVLAYVSEVSKIATKNDTIPRAGLSAEVLTKAGALHNVMREDGEVYPGGEWTEMILANAPQKEGGYFKVKQIM